MENRIRHIQDKMKPNKVWCICPKYISFFLLLCNKWFMNNGTKYSQWKSLLIIVMCLYDMCAVLFNTIQICFRGFFVHKNRMKKKKYIYIWQAYVWHRTFLWLQLMPSGQKCIASFFLSSCLTCVVSMNRLVCDHHVEICRL